MPLCGDDIVYYTVNDRCSTKKLCYANFKPISQAFARLN